MTDDAFMPLHSATAAADRATARARVAGPSRPPASVPSSHGRTSVSGTKIQGSIAICRNSPDMWPMMLSATGDIAYARPAAARVPCVPMPIRPASRTVPAKAAMSSTPIHSRCTIHPSTRSSLSNSKNGPIGNR